jgi:hypothetical protein
MGSEIQYDPDFGSDITIMNDTDIADSDVIQAINDQHPELAALTRWSQTMQSGRGDSGLIKRDRFLAPQGIFAQIQVGQDIAESDDVASNIIDTTEQLAFNRVVVECDDLDEQDIWRQIMDDIDIEARMREMWREMFIASMVHPMVFFGKADVPYKVSGRSDSGTKRKKTFNDLEVPLGVSILDPLKIVPVGNFSFGQEKLAYLASREEIQYIESGTDPLFSKIIIGKYDLTERDLSNLHNETGDRRGIGRDNLYLLNPDSVTRLTATRSSYQRFPSIRMKSIFDLMDMKAQLREMDRQHLVGASNFILLVTKGTDTLPAKAGEVDRLAAQVKTAARIPIIISDHRVDIKIITPNIDRTLDPARYGVIDSRIAARLYQMFVTGRSSAGAGSDDSTKLVRVVARSMEARRSAIRSLVMRHIIMPTFEKNDSLQSEPNLRFYPSRISLEFDPNFAVYLQDLRDRGDISRYTTLAEIDLDEADEARKREMEKEKYDDIFSPVIVPFSTVPPGAAEPAPADPSSDTPGNSRGGGRRGGGKTGGGGTNRDSLRSGPGRGPAKPDA